MNSLKNKSIAIVIPDFDHGGEEKRAVFFANGYLENFEEVYLLAPDGLSNPLLDSRVKHIPISVRNLFAIFRALKIIRMNRIDFLQGHKRATMPLLFLAQTFLNIKCIFNFDNIYPGGNYICKFITPKYIVYLSDVLKSFYSKYYRRYSNTTIHMGGDFYQTYSEDKKSAIKTSFNLQGQFVFLSLGRLSNQKNHKLLIEAIRLIKEENFICLVAGIGPLEEELKSKADLYSIGNKIKFLGHCNTIEELLNVSDCLVQSSLFEGFPNVFIEAASTGLPIVATEVGSSGTLVKENGILVPSENPDKLSQAMLTIMKQYAIYKEEAVNMSKSDFFKQFHKSKMLSNYIDYYKKISEE